MNKKLSRIAAIALSAAMVTSAFAMSTSASFAAASASITPTALTYAAVYSAAGDTYEFDTAFQGATAKVQIGNVSVTPTIEKTTDTVYSITSGTNVAEIKKNADGSQKNIELKSAGTFTVTATKFKVDTTLETEKHNHKTDVKADSITVTSTVKVYDNGAALVIPTANAVADGKVPSNSIHVGFNEDATFNLYKVTAAAGNAAHFEKDTTNSYDYASSVSKYVFAGADPATPTSLKNNTTGSVTISKQDVNDINTGVSTISATVSEKATKAASATLYVDKYYGVAAGDTAKTEVSALYGTDTATVLGGYNVTGTDIKVPATSTLELQGISNKDHTSALSGAEVGNISGDGAVIVDGGTAKDITVAGNVTIKPLKDQGNAIVGNITGAATVSITGQDKTQKNSDNTYSSVKTGNVTADAVNLETSEDVVNGKLRETSGAVTVGNVATSDTNGSARPIKVTTTKYSKNLTVGTITGTQGNFADCPYTATFELAAGKFTTGDLKYIGDVKVVEGASLKAGAIATGTADTAANAVCKRESKGMIEVGGDLEATSINTQVVPTGIDAAKGTITLPANSFTIADNSATDGTATGLTLYIKNVDKGTVLYTSARKASSLFKTPGVESTESTNSGKNIYTYSVAKAEFLGFTLDQSSLSLGDGASATLKAQTIGGALPAGVTVQWTADNKSVELTPSTDTLSCSVKSVGYTAQNINNSNNVRVTAVLMKDGAAFTPFNSDKSNDNCDVTLTAEVAPVLTTKVKNLNDTEAKAVTGDTVIKMTQSTYATVDFSADKAGISEAALAFHTGNDKVAQTGTYTKWNGTAGKYNVYANGAVGSKVGVFANGVKVFQIEIVDRPFKCDTTLDLDGVKGKALTVGQKYSFKIYDATTAIKDFTFLTANDSAVASWGFVKNADGTVTATIKALKATDKIGVYAKINGVTYKVFAAAVK